MDPRTELESAEPFDPRRPMHRADPSVAFAQLRSQCPIAHVTGGERDFFVVSRSADVEAIAQDVELWRSARSQGLHYNAGEPGPLGGMDGPDHDRQKSAIIQYFLPRSMKALRPKIAALVDEIFDPFVTQGRGDFVAQVAYPLPAMVIAELLGVPKSDRDWFKQRSDMTLMGLNGDPAGVALMIAARADLTAYLDARIDEKAAELEGGGPVSEDLLAHMVRAWKTTGALSRQEINDIGKIMLVAGHETTTSLIGMMMMRLIDDPRHGERLRQDPSLIPVFVEEVLRVDGPVQGLFRTNIAPAQIHGVDIPPETKVQILFASANLDPQRFEAAERFSLDRDLADLRRKNAAFGIGLHYCTGAPVARMEAELALARMVVDLKDATLDGETDLVKAFVLRGYSRLPIRWTPQT